MRTTSFVDPFLALKFHYQRLFHVGAILPLDLVECVLQDVRPSDAQYQKRFSALELRVEESFMHLYFSVVLQ
jgi:hypothetical protein